MRGMLAVELGCLAIIALYLALRVPRDPEPRRLIARMLVMMAAGWLTEDACIHLYGFYGYSPEWTVILDKVPLLVIMIWPVVIHSAWDLGRALASASQRAIPAAAIVGALIVLADASLIEPIAVRVGLWQWYEPGIFTVPVIGIVGWSLFTLLCLWAFEARRLPVWSALAISFVGTHLGLLALWWGGLRWVSRELDPAWVAGAAWCAALPLAVWMWRRGVGQGMGLRLPMLRAPGAAFFFVLLAVYCTWARDAALIAYALAFGLPYAALCLRAGTAEATAAASG